MTQVRTPETRRLQRHPGRLRRDRRPQGHQAATPATSSKAGVTPRRHVAEIRTADAASYAVGQEVGADTFAAGDDVDVTGTTKGKGFAGTMKRHGFHGVERLPRCPPEPPQARLDRRLRDTRAASSRACGCPVAWGSDTVTTQNVTVHAVDAEKGLILLKGAVPGPKGGLARDLRSAAKRTRKGAEHGDRRLSGIEGTSTVKVDLPAEIFDVEVNIPLIHQVVVAQQAAARQGTHATKTRGEVRGGGRKPYKQKGTGRARQGSTRAPQFAGGGVVHGPQPRGYAQRTPKKMKAAALRGALSDRARDGRVHVVESCLGGDKPSTKGGDAALAALTERPRVLVVLERGRRRDLALAAQRRRGAHAERRPAQHLRRARAATTWCSPRAPTTRSCLARARGR